MQLKGDKILLIMGEEGNLKNRVKEMEDLIKSSGGILVSTITQNIREKNAKYFFGIGKLEYMKSVADELKVSTIIVNEDISPSQLTNLIDFFKLTVLDRTMLILELFKERATSSFAKKRIELATLEYMYPRLTGYRENYDKQSGSGKLRGKGEQKLELDRRRLRNRISFLKDTIEKMISSENTKTEKRRTSDIKTVSLIGYSNTGKSTLLNSILSLGGRDDKKVYADDRLFATLDTKARLISLPHGAKMILTDTVGLIRDLPKTLYQAFSSTLGEIKNADLLIEVVDISNPYHEVERETTRELLDDLELGDKDMITVYNKTDKLHNRFLANKNSILMSGLNKDHVYDFLVKLEELLFGEVIETDIYFKHGEEAKMNEFLSRHKLIDMEYDNSGVSVRAYTYKKGSGLYEWI